MRLTAAISLLLAMLTTEALAQTIRVRSGDHPTFSRLTMRVPANTDWSIEQTGRDATIVLSTSALRFNTRRVFQRIQKTRLAGLQPTDEGNGLQLALACDCSVVGFVLDDSLLVVDIHDQTESVVQAPIFRLPQDKYRFRNPAGNFGPFAPGFPVAGAARRQPTQLPGAGPQAPEPGRMQMAKRDISLSEQRMLAHLARAADQETGAPEHVSSPTTEDTQTGAGQGDTTPAGIGQHDLRLPITWDGDDSPKRQPAAEPQARSPRLTPEVNANINMSEQRLLEQIGRATDQGLLDPVRALEPIADVSRSQAESARVTAISKPDRPSVSVTAMTAIDRDMTRVSGALGRIGEARECLPSDLLALHEWGGESEFSDRIGQLRSDLYAEFDRLDPRAADALAKTYLHYGFGAEAREALLLVEDHLENRELLLALADILDDRKASGANPFDGQQNCEGDAAMWSVLARPSHAWEANTDAVTRAFARLPGHLRSYLGPRLSRIFSGIDKPEIAATILRRIDLTEESPGPDQEFAAAAIEKSRGETGAAVEKMSEVIETDSEFSPQAVVELVDTHWRERMPLDADMSLLVASYAAEFRETDLGPDLRWAHSIALALSNAFDPAFGAYSDLSGREEETRARQALLPLLHLLTENADDVSFLKFGLRMIGDPSIDLPVDLEDKMARRMLDLGFAEPAIALLSAAPGHPTSPERRLMRAEAALAMDLPHRALVDLLSVSGPKAASLRAEAMTRNGDHKIAGQVLTEADMAASAARGFWLDEDWKDIVARQDSPYGRMAEMSEQLLDDRTDQLPQTPLARARALLDDSQTTRAQINELLDLSRNAQAQD